MLCNLFSCKKKPANNVVKIVYDAREHRASNRSRKEVNWLLAQKKDVDNYYLRFSEQSKYRLHSNNQNYLGWNKILGSYQFNIMAFRQSFGMHANSHRIVWRYNHRTDTFDVATYTYLHGERTWEIVKEGIEVGEIVQVPKFEKLYHCNANAYFGGIYTTQKDCEIEVW